MIMEKNWLIRTKSNHILGPVSKEKVLELYKNGSIKPDDEVCSGNGFWFFVREDDMVNKYLLGDEVQSFNPISEAKDVLTLADTTSVQEPEQSSSDITLVSGLNLSMLNEDKADDEEREADKVLTSEVEEPVPEGTEMADSVLIASETPKKKSRPVAEAKASSNLVSKPPLKKQNYLKYLGILGFLILFILIYYRKTIIRSLFEGEMTMISHFVSSAHAQENIPEKKKSF